MNYQAAHKEFERLFHHQMSDNEMKEFLLSMVLDESTSVEAIAAAADVMKSHAIELPVNETLQPKLIDIVGTGGDKIGSFNISSTTALLCASAGCYVAKHGNRSITSKSGSADMLEELGIRLDLSLQNSAKLLEESGFTFMFAQNHHPAMKFIMPVRKSIDVKTIFNVLGPLTNPAKVSKIMMGVFDKAFVPKLAEVLKINSTSSAMVVSSVEGMDEFGLSGVSYTARLVEGKVGEALFDPQNYGIQKAPLSAILGGDAKENAQITYNIFTNQATDAQRDIVLINSAASLVVDGMARDMQDGLEIAREMLLSLKAKKKLEEIVEITKKL